MEGSQTELDLKALENFLIANRDLERLEALLDRFNILEALGVVRQELRHSDFLRFLLDPRNPHGLGDAFVKRLLQRALMVAGDVPVPVTPIELELWDLGRVEVRREWNYIDILLLDEAHKLAVIVENKIGSGEHSDQLRRYLEVVERHYPAWRVVALFLTPAGEAPSHGSYLPVDYGLVCEVMDGLAEGMASVVSPDLKILMTHYSDMMRRNILGDSDVARLCRQIYRQHKRAIDLIYDHRFGDLAEIKDMVGALIEAESGFEVDSTIKNKTRVARLEWDRSPLLTAQGWSKSNRIILFEFWYYPDDVQLFLFVGPGPDEIRQRLFDMVDGHPEAFRGKGEGWGSYGAVYKLTLLEGEEMQADTRDRDRIIRRRWAEFLDVDLPKIDAALKNEEWIWESDEPDEGRSGRGERFGWGDGDIEITRRPDEPRE